MGTTLNGIVREKLGSRWARRLRMQGRIPCCVQGEGRDNVDLSIEAEQFVTARRHHQHLFEIQLDRGEPETVMVYELQWDPIGTDITHVEFKRVVMGRKTELEVEIEFTGHPKGGVLNHLLTHVRVSCLPSDIPDSVEVLVEKMEIGDMLHAKDLTLPPGSELAMDPETPIAVVSIVRTIEEEPAAEVEAAAVPVIGAAAAEEDDAAKSED